MKTIQLRKTKNSNWEYISEKTILKKPLVLVFGNRYLLEDENVYNDIPFSINEQQYFFSFYEVEIPTGATIVMCNVLILIIIGIIKYFVNLSRLAQKKDLLT